MTNCAGDVHFPCMCCLKRGGSSAGRQRKRGAEMKRDRIKRRDGERPPEGKPRAVFEDFPYGQGYGITRQANTRKNLKVVGTRGNSRIFPRKTPPTVDVIRPSSTCGLLRTRSCMLPASHESQTLIYSVITVKFVSNSVLRLACRRQSILVEFETDAPFVFFVFFRCFVAVIFSNTNQTGGRHHIISSASPEGTGPHMSICPIFQPSRSFLKNKKIASCARPFRRTGDDLCVQQRYQEREINLYTKKKHEIP